MFVNIVEILYLTNIREVFVINLVQLPIIIFREELQNIKIKDPKKNYHCLNCGKELKYVSGNYMKYCSAKCQTEYQHKEYIKRWKNGEETGVTGKTDISTHIRKYLKEKFNNSCQKCGWN